MILKETALATSGASIGTHTCFTYLQAHSLFTKLLVLQDKNTFTTQNLPLSLASQRGLFVLPVPEHLPERFSKVSAKNGPFSLKDQGENIVFILKQA